MTSATQSGGSGNLQDQAQYIQENVDGTNIKVTAGHTYAVAIRLTKSQALDWANASGQVSIAPNGSNSNGTWTAVEYATESGKEYSYAAGASTATVDITKLTDADSYVTVLYTFKANDDATTGSRAAYLEFTGTTSVNKLSTNTNNTDANQQIEAWSYATQVMDTSVAAGTVVVHYVDENGNKIADDTTVQGDVDNTYTVTPATFSNYTLDTTKSSALTGTVAADTTDSDGNVTAAGTELTLVYSQNTEASNLTVNYVDADGNTILPSKTYTEGADGTAAEVGGAYSVNAASIDGYTLTGDATQTGTFVSGGNTVTFTYTKDAAPVEQSTVTVNYVDADGNTIKASNVTEYIVGQAYTVGQPEIAGYSYNHSTGDAIAGTIGYNGNTVTLVYTKNGGTTTAPTTAPTVAPTTAPTVAPTTAPTTAPTVAPTTAPTTAPTVAPTTAPGTGDNVNGGGTGTTTTAPVTTPSDDTVDNGNGSSNNGSSTTTSTAPATTVSDDEVTPTTTATTNNGTSGVVPASASLKPVVTTKTTTSDAKTLPQTDEDENGTALAVLGLSTLLMGSALYFGVSRRKHEA